MISGPIVYFLQRRNSCHGLIKIGKTKNARMRFGEIQRMCPVPLRLLGWMPGYTQLEAKWHRRFAGARVYGEWFWPHDRLLCDIPRNGSSTPLPKSDSESEWQRFCKRHLARGWLPPETKEENRYRLGACQRCEQVSALESELARAIEEASETRRSLSRLPCPYIDVSGPQLTAILDRAVGEGTQALHHTVERALMENGWIDSRGDLTSEAQAAVDFAAGVLNRVVRPLAYGDNLSLRLLDTFCRRRAHFELGAEEMERAEGRAAAEKLGQYWAEAAARNGGKTGP